MKVPLKLKRSFVRRSNDHTGAAECDRAERANPFADNDLNHDPRAFYASQHSRMRSNRKILSALQRWQRTITYTTPWTSSTRRGVIMRAVDRFPPCSYTMVMAHRSTITVEKASKPAGGSMAETDASAKVSSGERCIKSDFF